MKSNDIETETELVMSLKIPKLQEWSQNPYSWNTAFI